MKYRKKPVVIDAAKFMGFGEEDEPIFDCDKGSYTEPWLWGNWQNGKIKYLGELGKLVIQTLEGTMQASVGDYIIKGVNGEIYPCKPDIFEKTYEKA